MYHTALFLARAHHFLIMIAISRSGVIAFSLVSCIPRALVHHYMQHTATALPLSICAHCNYCYNIWSIVNLSINNEDKGHKQWTLSPLLAITNQL